MTPQEAQGHERYRLSPAGEVVGFDEDENPRWRIDRDGVWQIRLDGKERRITPRREFFYHNPRGATP